VLFLQLSQKAVFVAEDEAGHDGPFGDLRAKGPVAGCYGDGGRGVEGGGLDLVAASGD
jgi:hypothetical protein